MKKFIILMLAVSSNAFAIDYLTPTPEKEALRQLEMLQYERDLNREITDNYNQHRYENQQRIDRMIDETNRFITDDRRNNHYR